MPSNGASHDKKPHIVPKSDAKHPKDRWETLFVYEFILKFTNLRAKIEGFESPTDLEDALLSNGPNDILQQILTRFVLNLRPQTRNLSADVISSTVSGLLSEYFKTSERTVFWNEKLHRNVDPFDGTDGGFFSTSWQLKLEILRQLVELQLCHAPEIKATIDRAWGVQHQKTKKKEVAAPVDPSGDCSKSTLQFVPLGQDSSRRRYWIADDSPRIYISTNPWKTSATFESKSTTRDEYLATIAELKACAPQKVKKMPRVDTLHLALIDALENRVEIIDQEINRVNKVRKKLEQKQLLLAQAEVRQTRTRRQAKRPDYTYANDSEDEGEGDEYHFQEDEDDIFEVDDFGDELGRKGRGRRGAAAEPTRRSARNANNKRGAPDNWSEWRGERRSARLGAPPETQLDEEPRTKRARTVDSVTSGVSGVSEDGPKSAAAVKPNEIVVDQVAGKKRSKFWYYAVESTAGPMPSNSSDATVVNSESGMAKADESDGMDIDMSGVYEDSYASETDMAI